MFRVLMFILVFCCHSATTWGVTVFDLLNLPDSELLNFIQRDPDLLFQQEPRGHYAIEFLVYYNRIYVIQELVMENHWIVHRSIKRNLIPVIRMIANHVYGTWTSTEYRLYTDLPYTPYQLAVALGRPEIERILRRRGCNPWWTP